MSDAEIERQERNFKRDFALAMWEDLPESAKKRLREGQDNAE